ncbi:MAG TPA: VWA domain-containing protein [Planctomycetota bacterium]|nr:VWA domain-containing protein [Planctomycetota bacterium]
MSLHTITVALVLCSFALAPANAAAADVRVALTELVRAQRAKDSGAFIAAFADVLPEARGSHLKTALDAYGALSEALDGGREVIALHELHRQVAALLAKAELDRDRERAIERERTKSRSFRVRVLLLDAACLRAGADRRASALEALGDKHPVVLRRALHYLANDKRPETVEAIVARFEKVETAESPKAKGREVFEWSRTEGAFHDALTRLLGVRLPSALDWRNWVDARTKEGNLFREPEERKPGRSELSLFGADVTGKCIVFIVDVSGSMVIPDPRPQGDDDGRGRTVVGEAGPRGLRPEEVEERRRIHRAKRELAKVVRALPEDVRFNVIAYSSEVAAWKRSTAVATRENKEDAVRFVEALAAEGLTATDMALEEAFLDIDIDTIYLLTDGAPTHVGSARITDETLPSDSKELMEDIIERLEVLNFLRGVRIHCLGFRGAHEEFLKRIATGHRGEYRPIP